MWDWFSYLLCMPGLVHLFPSSHGSHIIVCVCVCVRLYVSVRACVAYACLDDHTADWFGLCVSSVLWRVIKWNLKR